MSYDLFKQARNALSFSQSLRDKLSNTVSYQREQPMATPEMKPMAEPTPIQENQVINMGEDKVMNPLEMGGLEMNPMPTEKVEGLSAGTKEAPMKYKIPDRNLELDDADFNEAKKLLFSEISNKGGAEGEFEVKAILNTALNRMTQYAARGTPKTLVEVLREPNQYQGYNSPQYVAAASAALDFPSKKKMEMIEQMLEDIKKNGLEDNTGGRVFYVHEPGGTLKLKDGPLFK